MADGCEAVLGSHRARSISLEERRQLDRLLESNELAARQLPLQWPQQPQSPPRIPPQVRSGIRTQSEPATNPARRKYLDALAHAC